MAYNEQLADRIDLYFRTQNVVFYKKKNLEGYALW